MLGGDFVHTMNLLFVFHSSRLGTAVYFLGVRTGRGVPSAKSQSIETPGTSLARSRFTFDGEKEVEMNEICPACGKTKGRWSENNCRGCKGEDGVTYCSQRCAGRTEV